MKNLVYVILPFIISGSGIRPPIHQSLGHNFHKSKNPSPIIHDDHIINNHTLLHSETKIRYILNPSSPTQCDLIRRSSLYHKECNASSTNVRPLLVTGIGRTGTSYFQKLLASLHLDIRHDAKDDSLCVNKPASQCGSQGAVSWVHAFSGDKFQYGNHLHHEGNSIYHEKPLVKQCSYPRWTWNVQGLRFKIIIHLVRDPIKSIGSRARLNDRSLDWFEKSVQCATFVARQQVLHSTEWVEAAKKFFYQDIRNSSHLILRRNHAELNDRLRESSPNSTIGTNEHYYSSVNTHGLSEVQALVSDFKLVLSLRHFVSWNGFVEKIANHRLRVEDIGVDSVQWLCETVPELWGPHKCPPNAMVEKAIRSLGSKVNHNHVIIQLGLDSASITWSRLKDLDLVNSFLAQRMAIRFGYKIVPLSEKMNDANNSNHEIEEVGFSQFGQFYIRLSNTWRWKKP